MRRISRRELLAGPADVSREFGKFHALTGKPVLLADASIPSQRNIPRGQAYRDMLRGLRETPSCIGWHVCGAYLRNRVRGYGFLDENDRADPEFIREVEEANRETREWERRAAQGVSRYRQPKR